MLGGLRNPVQRVKVALVGFLGRMKVPSRGLWACRGPTVGVTSARTQQGGRLSLVNGTWSGPLSLIGSILIAWAFVLAVLPYATLMRDDDRPWNNAECGSLLVPHWKTYAENRPQILVSDEKTDFCYVAQLARADRAALAGATGVVLLAGGLIARRRTP